MSLFYFIKQYLLIVGFLLITGHLIEGWRAMAASTNETPYTVTKTLSEIVEIRKYPAQIVANTMASGERKLAANQGFRQLFDYISGNNYLRTNIPMTSPVSEIPISAQSTAITPPLQQLSGEEGWVIRFFMPSTFTLDNTPEPTSPNIQITETKSRVVAAIRFSGDANKQDLDMYSEQLRLLLRKHNYQEVGIAEYAFYSPPFIPPNMRRNEVLIPVLEQ